MGSLFETKNSGEKFFCDAYFRGGNSEMDFSLFLWGHFLRSNFWGKKFAKSSTFVF